MSVVVASIPTRRVEEVRLRRSRPLVYDAPTLPEPWVVRPWGRTGWYEARSPEGGLVMLRRVRGDAYVCDGEPRDLRSALTGRPWGTVDEVRDPSRAPAQARAALEAIAAEWPDDRPRDERGDLLDPAEPVIAVRATVAGRDAREAAETTTRERVETATVAPTDPRQPDREVPRGRG